MSIQKERIEHYFGIISQIREQYINPAQIETIAYRKEHRCKETFRASHNFSK